MTQRVWHIGSLPRWRGARFGGPPGGPILVALRQFLCEQRAKRLGQHFRDHSNAQALAAYERMSPGLFAGINARQAWANWQVIPRCLHGRAPARPLRALDLACGDGASSRALFYHLPPGSQVLGIEYAQQLVQRAKKTHEKCPYKARPWQLQIYQGSILAPLADAQGRRLADHSIDWIQSCGALAHHFTPDDLQGIAAECARVLAPNGWAAVDARSWSENDPVRRAFVDQGLVYQGYERSCPIDRYPMLCLQRLRE